VLDIILLEEYDTSWKSFEPFHYNERILQAKRVPSSSPIKEDSMLGPIDYIAVSFKGNNFDGSVLKALANATKSGVIRVVDLVFVIKDADGHVDWAEIEDQEDDLKEVATLLGHKGDLPLLTEDDVQKLGAHMPNDTSAGILVIEQLWAIPLKEALLHVGGELLAEGRIHPDKVSAAVEEFEQQK
jgi:hypothetical protein